MGAQAHDVLQEDLIVSRVQMCPILCELHAEAAEFRRRVVQHQGCAARVVCRQLPEIRRIKTAAKIPPAGIEPVVAQSSAPASGELIHALQVPAGLRAAVSAGSSRNTERADVTAQVPAIGAAEILTLQLQVGLNGVAIRCPFVDAVGDPGR